MIKQIPNKAQNLNEKKTIWLTESLIYSKLGLAYMTSELITAVGLSARFIQLLQNVSECQMWNIKYGAVHIKRLFQLYFISGFGFQFSKSVDNLRPMQLRNWNASDLGSFRGLNPYKSVLFRSRKELELNCSRNVLKMHLQVRSQLHLLTEMHVKTLNSFK